MAYEHAIVLTGGIATGKSTVSNILKTHGFEVIDADNQMIKYKVIKNFQ